MSPIDAFETERLAAERLSPAHLRDYRRLLQDARVTATLTPGGRPLPDEDVCRWLRFSLEHWDRHGFGFWVFRDRAEGKFVGRAGLKHTEIDGRPEVELGYALVPECWGRGLATEIAAAVVKLAFDRIGLEQVICYTLATNQASRRVMEKAGFRFEKEIIHEGLPHVFFRITPADVRG